MIRTKPLPRTRATPRTRVCVGCNERISSSVCPTCKTRKATRRGNIGKRCDALWAAVIKSVGQCEVPGHIYYVGAPWSAWPAYVITVTCGGRLEAAHVVPRRHRTTRWDLSNGRALCHDHHRFFTDHEKAWRDFVGPDWDRLWVKAQVLWSKQYPLAELTRALKAAKEAA